MLGLAGIVRQVVVTRCTLIGERVIALGQGGQCDGAKTVSQLQEHIAASRWLTTESAAMHAVGLPSDKLEATRGIVTGVTKSGRVHSLNQ